MGVKLPVQNYFQRTAGPSWVRPSDWPVITDAVNEVQFLMSDLGASNCSITTVFTRTSGSQNIIIDWGDGTTNTISTNTTTQHTYTPGTGTPCSLGYTTFKIRVYFTGTGVSVMSTCQIQALFASGNTFTTQTCNVLEVYYGNGTVPVNVPTFYSVAGNSSSLSYYTTLQYVKLPATVTWTNMIQMFAGCTLLTKLVMPTSASSLNSLSQAFTSCWNLLEVIFPSNSIGITSFSSVFTSCFNLRTVTLPTTLNSCTSISSAFSSCYNLRNLTLPSINACTNFYLAFNGCAQLEWVKFTSMPTAASVIDISQAFASCFNLQTVYFPATGTATSTYNFNSTFFGCPLLKTIILPSNINVSSFSSAFQACSSLMSCILPTSTPACTAFDSAFGQCVSLSKITLPTTAATGVTATSTFAGCYKLQEATIPSTLVFGNMQSMFSSCYSLKTLNWRPETQNSLTNLVATFNNCLLLSSITMPTSMTALTSMIQTFNNCRSLKTITLPSSLNAVTTTSNMFNTCDNLTSVTLPTSMSACTNFSSMFTNCRSITSITMPNTVSTSTTTFNSTFATCSSLKTIILPGADQLSLVTNVDYMFYICSNLTTITNFEKIGSLTTTPLMSASVLQYNQFPSISFAGPISNLQIQGNSSAGRANVQSVRLLNTSAGQWTGTSPQINVSNTNMSTANLVQLFTDMAAQGNVTSKTINITTASGTAGLTAANRLLITSKGWTITG